MRAKFSGWNACCTPQVRWPRWRSRPVPDSSRSRWPDRTPVGKEGILMLKKVMYSLGALAMLAMAVGAGFKPY